MKHYVGLDVSMKDTFICIVNERGENIYHGCVKTEPDLIAERIKKFQVVIDRVGIESGSISHWLADELKKRDLPAICIDARKMAAVLSVQVNKTDKNDSRGIAEAMRGGFFNEVTLKSKYALEVSTLMGCRRILIEQKVQLTNCIRGFLKTYGIRLRGTTDTNFSQKVREAMLEEHCIANQGIEALLIQYEALYQNIKEQTSIVEKLAEKDPDVIRLKTIPGIGTITAMTFKAEVDDPKRFKNSRSVGAYFGMTPRQYSSGETKRLGRISKCGSVEIRTLLSEAAVVLLTRSKKWSRLRAWGLKIQRKHGFKKACTAIGRKLAVIMHRMWVDNVDFIYGEPKPSKNSIDKATNGSENEPKIAYENVKDELKVASVA